MKLRLLLLFFYLSGIFSCSPKKHTTQVSFIKAGDATIQLQKDFYNNYDSSVLFIHLHENEFTSKQATHEYLTKRSGIFIQLNHTDTGARFIDFSYAGKSFRFDPNRMFTTQGREVSLQKLGSYTTEADAIITALADSLLAAVTKARLVIAVHNNTDANYSINSYTEGNKEAENTDELYIHPANDEDDFIITTEKKIFDAIQAAGKNVVLLKRDSRDDGSLSYYCGMHHIPYINIETQQTHYKEHLAFLNLLSNIINTYR